MVNFQQEFSYWAISGKISHSDVSSVSPGRVAWERPRKTCDTCQVFVLCRRKQENSDGSNRIAREGKQMQTFPPNVITFAFASMTLNCSTGYSKIHVFQDVYHEQIPSYHSNKLLNICYAVIYQSCIFHFNIRYSEDKGRWILNSIFSGWRTPRYFIMTKREALLSVHKSETIFMGIKLYKKINHYMIHED